MPLLMDQSSSLTLGLCDEMPIIGLSNFCCCNIYHPTQDILRNNVVDEKSDTIVYFFNKTSLYSLEIVFGGGLIQSFPSLAYEENNHW